MMIVATRMFACLDVCVRTWLQSCNHACMCVCWAMATAVFQFLLGNKRCSVDGYRAMVPWVGLTRNFCFQHCQKQRGTHNQKCKQTSASKQTNKLAQANKQTSARSTAQSINQSISQSVSHRVPHYYERTCALM